MPANIANSNQQGNSQLCYLSVTGNKRLQYASGMKLRIKELRNVAGMTQREVAEAAGMSQPYYAQIERGARSPNQHRLEAIAKALKVSPLELLQSDETDLLEIVRSLTGDDRQTVYLLAKRLVDGKGSKQDA